MKATYRLQGGKALEDALAQLRETTRERIVKETLLKAAEPVVEDARALAPRRTGNTSRSIGAGSKLTRRQASRAQKLSAVEVYIGPSPTLARRIRQAVLLEFGTYKMRPRPFMRPAFLKNVDAMLTIIRNQLWLKIRLVADRADKSGRGP